MQCGMTYSNVQLVARGGLRIDLWRLMMVRT